MSHRKGGFNRPPERVRIYLEEPEDLWHAYNLISAGDQVTAQGNYRVTAESSTGSTISNRVRTNFTITVKSIDFDPGASELHVAGQIAKENSYAKLGQFQTLHLNVADHFTLVKADDWDTVSLEVLSELTDRRKRADKSTVVIAVMMQEGLANICSITEHRTILNQRVTTAIPRKRQGGIAAHDERLKRFYDQTLAALLRYVTLDSEQPILLASPGFTASAFLSHILSDKVGADNPSLKDYKSKFIVAHASSGHVHALHEVLKSPDVQTRLAKTRFAKESKLMDGFMELLRKDEGWAWYGPGEVTKAVERGAVGKGGGKLLISLELFRANDVAVRKRYVALVEAVKDYGGDVTIFSDQTESGKRLQELSGVAAILTYPLQDLEVDDEDEDEDDNDADADQAPGRDGEPKY